MGSLIKKGTVLAKQMCAQAKPQWELFLKYAKVELVPPTPAELPAIRQSLGKIIQSAKSGGYKELTIREIWLNTLISVEVICWFYMGECIGKRHFVGYNV